MMTPSDMVHVELADHIGNNTKVIKGGKFTCSGSWHRNYFWPFCRYAHFISQAPKFVCNFFIDVYLMLSQ